MIKFAVIVGTAVGVTYYLLMSAVWNTATSQVDAYQKQYQQAVAMTEQMEQAASQSTR
jgi:hypothetical protein